MAFARYSVGLIGCLMIGSHVGCATIVSEKRYPVTIDNVPGPTYFSIYDRKHQIVDQGVTPKQVTLDAKAFPFWPAKYTVVMAGTESTSQRHELNAGLDPWVAGNLVLGGGLGAIVDGATGAMFKLPKRISGNVANQYAVSDPQTGSMIVSSEMGGGDGIPNSESMLDSPTMLSPLSGSHPSVMSASHVRKNE